MTAGQFLISLSTLMKTVFTWRLSISGEDERPFCYFKAYGKWWSFGFETLKKLAGGVLDARDTMVERFLKLTDQQSQKGIQ